MKWFSCLNSPMKPSTLSRSFNPKLFIQFPRSIFPLLPTNLLRISLPLSGRDLTYQHSWIIIHIWVRENINVILIGECYEWMNSKWKFSPLASELVMKAKRTAEGGRETTIHKQSCNVYRGELEGRTSSITFTLPRRKVSQQLEKLINKARGFISQSTISPHAFSFQFHLKVVNLPGMNLLFAKIPSDMQLIRFVHRWQGVNFDLPKASIQCRRFNQNCYKWNSWSIRNWIKRSSLFAHDSKSVTRFVRRTTTRQ